jgi:hypothetical protein
MIPPAIEIIPKSFLSCPHLQRVVFADGPTLSGIGESAFAECRLLSSFDFPAVVAFLGTACFKACAALTSLSRRTSASPESRYRVSGLHGA